MENTSDTIENDFNNKVCLEQKLSEEELEKKELTSETFSSCMNDEEIYELLCKIAYNKKYKEKFNNYFYRVEHSELQSKEFSTVGIFQDLSYFHLWVDNLKYEKFSKNLKEDFDITYWRRIKGDGNCYYRSVLINYIEILLINSYEKRKPYIFFSLLKDIIFTNFPKNKETVKKLSITALIAIYESLLLSINDIATSKLHIHKCFDILYRAYNRSDLVERLLILWIRIKLTAFLKENLDLEFNGLKLVQCIPGFELEDDMSYDKNAVLKYIDNELCKMDEFVEGYPLYITPIILKVDINIFFIDDFYKPLKIDLKYYGDIDKNITPILNYLYDFKKNSNQTEINILFTIPHYDTLYSNVFVDQIVSYYNNMNVKIIEGQFSIQEFNELKDEIFKYANWIKRMLNPLSQVLESNKDNTIIRPYDEKSIIVDFSKAQIENENIVKNKKHLQLDKKKNEIKKCKDCKVNRSFITLSDGCLVCQECQKNTIYKENGKNESIVYERNKNKRINKCINCKYTNIIMADYELIFNGKITKFYYKK